MKHINILASIALAAFTLTSCQQDLNHNMVPDKLGFAYTENLQQPSVFKAGMSVSVIKSGKGSEGQEGRADCGPRASAAHGLYPRRM